MPHLPASACWRRSRSADPPLPRCRCRSPSCVGVAVAASPRPELRHRLQPRHGAHARGRHDRGSARRSGRRPGGVDRARARAPRGGQLGRRRGPDRVPARGGGVPTSRLRARLRALGRVPDRARRRSHPERVRPALDDGAGRRRAAASCLPSAGASAPRRAGVRHDPVLRQPGVPCQGGGNRVRRYPPVRAPATASAGSTGGRAPAASGCTSTRATPSARAT